MSDLYHVHCTTNIFDDVSQARIMQAFENIACISTMWEVKKTGREKLYTVELYSTMTVSDRPRRVHLTPMLVEWAQFFPNENY